MKFWMDEISFEGGGTEVHMWKAPARQAKTTRGSDNKTASSPSGNAAEPSDFTSSAQSNRFARRKM